MGAKSSNLNTLPTRDCARERADSIRFVASPTSRGIEEPAPTIGSRLPRIGVVSAWFDPEDSTMWSGVPRRLVDELRRLGVFAGHRSAIPWPPVSNRVRRWMQLTGRGDGWTRRSEMRLLTRLSDRMLRATTPSEIDGWVHLVGQNGPVTRGKYVTLHEMSPAQLLAIGPDMARSFGFPYLDRSQLEWVARRQADLYRHAYACCVASRWAADSLVRDLGLDARRVHVVGYGRNKDPAAPEDRDWSSPRFLFIGRDWERKNGDAVVRAFLRIRREIPDARLDVVGGPEHRLEVEGVVEHRVDGFVPGGREQIEELLAKATCFVMPSFVEPFGIVYTEAAAAGLPSVATSIGGTTDSVGDGGILVDPHDDDDIYRGMRNLCDSDTARRLGGIARQRSTVFTWSAFGQRVVRSLDLGTIPGVTLADFL
jgi:glycosyltransferase involved in cell wall biosynthesis